MKKEIKKELTPTEVNKALDEVFAVKQIAPLTLDFAREDMNQLRDKVNELITAFNSP